MKRRYFIWLSVLTESALAIPVVIKTRLNALKKPLIIPDVLSHFCDEDTIRNIGKAYRSRFPSENDFKKLSELIIAGINNGQVIEDINNVNEEQLDKQISDEFKSNNIIIIDGWVLTATEGRQCALLSLTDRKAVPASTSGGWHHMGTTRMSNDPKTGLPTISKKKWAPESVKGSS